MPAVASTIFKIRAHTDFIAPSDAGANVLSFRKGQPFYALNADYERGTYFVSTQFAVPFSRSSVSGLVPMEYFEKVDLLSKDPPMRKKQVAPVTKTIVPKPAIAVSDTPALPPVPIRKQSLSHNSVWNDTISDIITFIEVLSMSGDDSFCIKVVRGKMAHIINRSIPEFIALAAAAGDIFPKINAENYPLAQTNTAERIRSLEIYLNRLTGQLLPSLSQSQASKLFKARDVFFNPKDSEEFIAGQAVLRRDSGASTDANTEKLQFDSRAERALSKVSISIGVDVKSPRQKSARNPFSAIGRMMSSKHF